MLVSILVVVLIIIGLIGFFMVNKVGNYENIWGTCLFGGFGFAAIIIIISLARLCVGLIFFL